MSHINENLYRISLITAVFLVSWYYICHYLKQLIFMKTFRKWPQ